VQRTQTWKSSVASFEAIMQAISIDHRPGQRRVLQVAVPQNKHAARFAHKVIVNVAIRIYTTTNKSQFYVVGWSSETLAPTARSSCRPGCTHFLPETPQ
jgi:hypothetical protein